MNLWIVAGVVGAGLFLINQKVSASPTTVAVNTKPPTNTKTKVNGFPLKAGSKGENVKRLQKALYVLGNSAVRSSLYSSSYNSSTRSFDGIFGSGTQQALVTVTGNTTIDYTQFVSLLQRANIK